MMIYREKFEILSLVSIGLYIASVLTFSYDTQLNRLSHYMFIIMIVISTIYLLLKNDKLKWTSLDNYLIFLLIYSLISSLWSNDIYFSLKKCNTFFQLIILANVVYFVIDTQTKIYKFLHIILYSIFFMYIYTICIYGWNGFLLIANGEGRLGTEINQANAFGLYCSFAVLIILYSFFIKNNKYIIILLPIPIIMGLLTGSKKVILLYLFIFLCIYLHKDREHLLKKVVKILLIIFAFISIIIYSGFAELLISRTANAIYGEDMSTIYRIEMIKIGLDLFKRNPIFGYGIESYNYYYSRYTGREGIPAHNNYIQIAVSFGIIGLVCWYGIYYKFFKIYCMYKENNELASLLFVILITLILNDLTTTCLLNKITYVILGMSFRICYCLNQVKMETYEKIMYG